MMKASGHLMRQMRPGTIRHPGAFVVIELAVVLTVLLLLVLLVVPSFGRSKADSHRGVCMDNLHRLGIGWQMYADDHDGRLAANAPAAPRHNWVHGWLDYSESTDNTDPQTIENASLFQYVGNTRVYRCPSDPSRAPTPDGPKARTRSYSMNGWLGENAQGSPPGFIKEPFQLMERSEQVLNPRRTFVFIDEHPDSINDGTLFVEMGLEGKAARIIDFPGSLHSAGANLSFADGAVEYRQWQDPRTILPLRFDSIPLNVPSPNNPDVERLKEVTTYSR